MGLKSTTPQLRVIHSTDWASQVPQNCTIDSYQDISSQSFCCSIVCERGAWVAQVVKRSTFGFSSSSDLRVVGMRASLGSTLSGDTLFLLISKSFKEYVLKNNKKLNILIKNIPPKCNSLKEFLWGFDMHTHFFAFIIPPFCFIFS